MSVIQKIRDRYAKLAGGLIAVALISFILMDAVRGSYFHNLFSGSSNSVAKVNGDNLEIKDYSQRMIDYDNLYAAFSKGQPLTDEVRANLHQQALTEMISEHLAAKDIKKLGITVTEQEQNDMIRGNQPDQIVRQFLVNVFGTDESKFDPQMAKQLEQAIKKASTDRSNPNSDQIQKVAVQWEAVKAFAIRNRLMQKYSAMSGNSVYVPKFILDRQMADQNNIASIRYVKVAAATIPDAQATVTDNDIKAYLDKHAARYTVNEESRSIDYVAFDVKPDAGDTARSRDTLNNLHNAFATATDNEGFIGRNSEEPYSDKYLIKKTFMSPYTDSIFNMPVGGVFGPYFDKGAYKMVKVVEKRTMPDSVKAQHILIAVNQGTDDSAAHKRADSLMAAVKAGANFDSLAAHYSDDPGSKIKGGDLGFFAYGQMVPEFNDAVFQGATGELKEVKSQFGWHVIKITAQAGSMTAAKLAIVSKALSIGDKAINMASNKAQEFVGTNNTATAFDAAAKKQNLNKLTAENIKPADFQITGIGPSRELIRNVYDAKVGDVLPAIRIGDRYIVAKVAAEQTKGPLQLTAANRQMLESATRNEKKMDMIIAKYKSVASLDAIAQQSGTQIAQADSFNAASSMIGKGDYAPVVAGYTFYPKFALNTLSPGMKVNGAVYYIMVTARQQTAPPANPMAMKQARQMAEMQGKQAAGGAFMEMLTRRGTITYYPKNIN